MLRLAVVEDNDETLQTIQDYLARFMKENAVSFAVDVYRDGEQIVFNYEAVYDIVLMDIEMPKMDGMTAAKKIREMDPSVILIFVTNMAQYAIEGYKVRARAYILKPINYYGFSIELQEAVSSISMRRDDAILLPDEEGLVRVQTMDILYVEVQKHNVMVHTKSRGIIQIRSSMKQMEEELKDFHFYRCDASYLVNMAHVSSILADSVLVEKEHIPVSRRRRKEFVEALSSYIGGSGK